MDFTAIFFHGAVEGITGYTENDFILGNPRWDQVIHQNDLPLLSESIEKIATIPDYSAEREYRIIRKDGQIRWIHEMTQNICNDSRKPILVQGAIYDITERKRAEEALRQLNEELEQRVEARTTELKEANREIQESLETLQRTQEQLIRSEKMAALGGLVAGIAHEINTPLGIAVTASSLLEENSRELGKHYHEDNMTRSDLEEYVHVTQECSTMILGNLRRAAQQIQGFKQVAVDQTTEDQRTFKVRTYIDEVLLSLQPKLKRTTHSLTVNCPKDVELVSYPGAFSQILTNLVINSLMHGFEHKEHGQIVLDVSMESQTLWIQYSDNGKGMADEQCSKIFEPFYTTKRGQGGTGLGLHIVYNLVTQRLNGQIVCESTLGEGTVFTIQIPIEDQSSIRPKT
jgi:PAS domain S-box-containing protein